MNEHTLLPHLFRTEFRKIVSVLSKLFGLAHIEVAEDVASETFLAALETWTFNGIPKNPTAWLYIVAKNKAKNYLRRNQVFADTIAGRQLTQETDDIEIDLSNKNISDSQLQMLFAVCHPAISTEAQVSLALRILCGLGIDEIATALLSNKETVNKRLFRAKEKLRLDKVVIEFPDESEINARLDIVMTTLYLLFNEGYYSESQDSVVRKDLCHDAMRLTQLLIENKQTDQPAVNAMLSLMCFHASRFSARQNENGRIVFYKDQDETLWDHELISKGSYYLHRAAKGNKLSKYHLEASIAYWHTIKEDTTEKWETILRLFDHLLQLEHSPVASLNRIYALSKVKGKQEAIREAEQLQLFTNHFYYILLGELYTGIDDQKAKANFENALSLAKTQTDRQTIQERIGSV